MYTVMDLFCGTGGFSKGFENAGGFRVVYGIDILPIAIKTFQANHPSAYSLCGDIREIRRSQVSEATGLKAGDIDVIIGGPPCQGFSSIRPFRSSTDDDPRNSLFEEFASYVNYFRPKVLVFENVVGLATYHNGDTIATILHTFDSLGYDCDWRILNAANYGVPQKRERLILLGVQKGGNIRFPSVTHYASGNTIGYRDHSRMMQSYADDVLSQIESMRRPFLPAVTVRQAIDDLPPIKSGEVTTHYSSRPKNAYQRDRRKDVPDDQLTLHNATKHSKKMLEIIRYSGDNIKCIPEGMVTSGFSSSYSRLRGDEPAVTLTVNFVHPASNKCIHPDLDRALTPREGARIQSFDDDFIFAGNRTQIVKQIGNAVPPLLGKALAKSVLEALEGSVPEEKSITQLPKQLSLGV